MILKWSIPQFSGKAILADNRIFKRPIRWILYNLQKIKRGVPLLGTPKKTET